MPLRTHLLAFGNRVIENTLLALLLFVLCVQETVHTANQIGDEDGAANASKRPAWVDDDDSHVSVSLASETRIRKLRKTEEEDVVTGAEYTEKLRERFTTTYSAHQAWAEAREADDEDGIQQWAGEFWVTAKYIFPWFALRI